MKHLITMTLGGILGLCLMAGDAEACHKNKCGGGCAQPVACAPVKTCAPKQKKCGGGMFSMCHKKKSCATCTGPVMAYYSAPMATGPYMGSPQYTAPVMGAPQIPTKGTPQR